MEPNMYATNTVHVDTNAVIYSDLCGLQVLSGLQVIIVKS